MKKVISISAVILLTIIGCKKSPKYYAIIEGKIGNPVSDTLKVGKSGKYSIIKVARDGSFRDTLKAPEEGLWSAYYKDAFFNMYIKNGFVSKVNIGDVRDVNNTISFEGDASDVNQYLVDYGKRVRKVANNFELFNLPQDSFDTKMRNFKNYENSIIGNLKYADSLFMAGQQESVDLVIEEWNSTYNDLHAQEKMVGKDSPKFHDYINYAGGTSSLDDYKGKFVYIDLWATWCGPCLELLPFLKQAEEKYADREDFVFVSISVDQEEDENKWRQMVKKKDMPGIQLFARGDTSFGKAFSATSLPRFLLIGPDGKTLRTNAPFPVINEPDYKEFEQMMASLGKEK